jgi:hypothetical protein
MPRNHEPTLAELFAEPIIRQLMARDGVAAETIAGLLQEQGRRRCRSALRPVAGDRAAA